MLTSKPRGQSKLAYTSVRLSLVLNSGPIKVTGAVFTELVEAALTGLYGIIGGALVWDLIDFQEDNCSAIIECHKSDEQRIWAAAAFMTQFKGFPCRLQVLETSPSLMPISSLNPDVDEHPLETTKSQGIWDSHY